MSVLFSNLTEVNQHIKFSSQFWEFVLPSIFAGADVISGLIQAQINGTKNSSIMRTGMYRKVGELMLIALCMAFCVAVNFPYDLAAIVAFWIVLMESLSIAENLKAAGVPIPDFITKKVRDAADAINKGEVETKDDEGTKDVH